MGVCALSSLGWNALILAGCAATIWLLTKGGNKAEAHSNRARNWYYTVTGPTGAAVALLFTICFVTAEIHILPAWFIFSAALCIWCCHAGLKIRSSY